MDEEGAEVLHPPAREHGRVPGSGDREVDGDRGEERAPASREWPAREPEPCERGQRGHQDPERSFGERRERARGGGDDEPPGARAFAAGRAPEREACGAH